MLALEPQGRYAWTGQDGWDGGTAPSPSRESRPPPAGIYMNGRPGCDDTAHIRGVTHPPSKYGHLPPRAPPPGGVPLPCAPLRSPPRSGRR